MEVAALSLLLCKLTRLLFVIRWFSFLCAHTPGVAEGKLSDGKGNQNKLQE